MINKNNVNISINPQLVKNIRKIFTPIISEKDILIEIIQSDIYKKQFIKKTEKVYFMPTDIKKFILNNITDEFISIKNKTYAIEIIIPKPISNKILSVNELIKIMVLVIQMYMYKKSIDTKFNRCIKIYYAPTKFKKNISENNNVIGYDNSNSGVSSSDHINKNIIKCGTSSDFIFIFRHEEFFKVLIHELSHLLEYDFSAIIINDKYKKIVDMSSKLLLNKINKYILKNYKSKVIIFNEAITEFIAVVLHVVYSANLLKTTTSDDIFYNLVNKMINNELLFSLFQTSKIFYLHDKHNTLVEKTHVLSYYLIKTLLLLNIDKITNMNDFLNNRSINNYWNFFSIAYYSIDSKTINIFNPYIKYVKSIPDKNSFEFKTFRLSFSG